jgi:hypothetical protein
MWRLTDIEATIFASLVLIAVALALAWGWLSPLKKPFSGADENVLKHLLIPLK